MVLELKCNMQCEKCAKLVIEINLLYKYSIVVHSIDCNTPVVLILCSTLNN